MEIIDWFNERVPVDKQLHFLVSFFLVSLVTFLLPLWISAVLVFFIGLMKESTDYEFDYKDVIANCLGIIAAIILLH